MTTAVAPSRGLPVLPSMEVDALTNPIPLCWHVILTLLPLRIVIETFIAFQKYDVTGEPSWLPVAVHVPPCDEVQDKVIDDWAYAPAARIIPPVSMPFAYVENRSDIRYLLAEVGSIEEDCSRIDFLSIPFDAREKNRKMNSPRKTTVCNNHINDRVTALSTIVKRTKVR